jgi:glucokinase
MFTGHADTYPRLVGDIGGTNARFALIEKPGAEIERIATLPCADHAGPEEAIRAYLAEHGQGMAAPRNAAFGTATPIIGDSIRFTNNDWAFSIETVRQRLGLDRLLFINDFTALALSIPELTSQEKKQVGGGAPVAGSTMGVIGPGTGLGVSGLIPCGKTYAPIVGEGGHVTLSPQTAEEMAIMSVLSLEHDHISAERVLSGPGLRTLYRAMAMVRGVTPLDITTPEVSARGLSGEDSICRDTLTTFCALLGGTAGNLALTLGALGGVYIGGGITPRLGEFFLASPFRKRFENKGRFESYLSAIPTYVISAAYPALTGSAVALSNAIG